jgi:hypothetical protein
MGLVEIRRRTVSTNEIPKTTPNPIISPLQNDESPAFVINRPLAMLYVWESLANRQIPAGPWPGELAGVLRFGPEFCQ